MKEIERILCDRCGDIMVQVIDEVAICQDCRDQMEIDDAKEFIYGKVSSNIKSS